MHLRSDVDLNAAQVKRVIELALNVKAHPEQYRKALDGKSVAVIFAKQSTRTRVSFEVGIFELGGHALVLTSGGSSGMQMGRGETIHDTAKTLGRMVDAIVIRTYAQSDVDELALHGGVPVVNALTDDYHPCQALADVQAIQERFGRTQGLKLVYAGAGNNVAHSLMLIGPRVGMDVVVACPASVAPNAAILARAQADAKEAGTSVTVSHDLADAVKGAHVIYTDTWVSMGQDADAQRLREELQAFQVNAKIMAAAQPDAVFMHCLPAHRGEEVTADVIDGPQSIVFDEAENRLHAQKALLMLLMGAQPW
ncbi:MAG: ornithine carbamoyltransferase [Myxococcota bacterium]|jgi:ornithine carbamoyltransferase|nr:ornithine carbamoyltransferase [Myxococcota bacterium]